MTITYLRAGGLEILLCETLISAWAHYPAALNRLPIFTAWG